MHFLDSSEFECLEFCSSGIVQVLSVLIFVFYVFSRGVPVKSRQGTPGHSTGLQGTPGDSRGLQGISGDFRGIEGDSRRLLDPLGRLGCGA